MGALADIVRAFGVDPDAIRLVSRRQNTHWRVRAGAERYALRRFGVWAETDGDADWEVAAVRQLAAAGAPVPAAIGPVREIDGARWLLMPWLPGRGLRQPTSDADYERLGACLAEFHALTDHLPAPPQRPGWIACVDAAFPLAGGAARRSELLAALSREDAAMAARFGEAAEALEVRCLPTLFADYPRRLVHGDFAPWNIRLRRGRLSGVLDFDLAHRDLAAVDVAFARRGYHDAAVRGYLARRPLNKVELANLDALWLGGVLWSVWRVLEHRLAEGSELAFGLQWNLEQLDKTQPYQP